MSDELDRRDLDRRALDRRQLDRRAFDRRNPAPGEADDGELLSESPAVAPVDPLGGQLGSASGGYGSGSDANSSGGTGDGTEDSSSTGDDAQTDWLRDAPGGGRP